MTLGSANPRLTNIAKEPLALSAELILTILVCYFYQDPRYHAVHSSSQRNFCPHGTPPYQITFRCSKVSVTNFSPFHLRDM